MANSGHPWDHLDEVQTMWRLGQDSKPPLPETVQGLTAEILNDCFIINPEARPTAMGLLKHPFCKRELQAFDFKSFKEEAILRNMNNEDDDSNRSSECQSMDDHHILDKLDSTVESPISPIYASGSTKMPSLKCVESPVSPMFALESANMLPPKCVESPILPLYASGSTNISSLK